MRFYPAGWRDRYGAEFTELLAADLAERPRCWRRTADVAASGLLARLSQAGLGGQRLAGADQARASLAALGGALAVFLTAGTAVWSQLLVGWQWAPPSTRAAAVATVLMTGTLLFFLVLAVLAAAPIGWQLARRGFRAGPARVSAALVVVSLLVLVIGGRHMANGWPGTGGHPWPQRGLVPGGVAAFGWAMTLSVTSYWAHPAALLAFPAAELAWMVISPVALAGLATGLARLVRRLDLSPGMLRYQARLGRLAAAAMAVFLAGAASWVLAGPHGPGPLFRPGAIDVAALAAMTLALAVGWQALRRTAPR